MKNKLLLILQLFTTLSLSAFEIFDYSDVGTLETKESGPIAINTQGMILGWYNVDGSSNGKQYFVRDENGSYYLLPAKDDSNNVLNWKFLTEDNKAYAIYSNMVYVWDKNSGFTKLVNLSTSDIVTIKKDGKILLRYTNNTIRGKNYMFPTIWQHNSEKKLPGLIGDLGIESEESYGLDMNNAGTVVGTSKVSLVEKNEIHKRVFAVKWVNNKVVDLHNTFFQKMVTSNATLINDLDDVYISDGYLISSSGQVRTMPKDIKAVSGPYFYNDTAVYTFNNLYLTTEQITQALVKDVTTKWTKALRIVSVNSKGHVLVEAETVFGEKHILVVTQKK